MACISATEKCEQRFLEGDPSLENSLGGVYSGIWITFSTAGPANHRAKACLWVAVIPSEGSHVFDVNDNTESQLFSYDIPGAKGLEGRGDDDPDGRETSTSYSRHWAGASPQTLFFSGALLHPPRLTRRSGPSAWTLTRHGEVVGQVRFWPNVGDSGLGLLNACRLALWDTGKGKVLPPVEQSKKDV